MVINVDELKLKSVGIDVGSSTSHLIMSELTLRKDENSPSRRFKVDKREVLYESPVIDTPLLDKNNINIPELIKFFQGEYENAGITPSDIDTGAVIVTGETAKKRNANEIIEILSEDAGKFVAATAGPNFESMLAALGSGVTNQSKIKQNTILSVDIGGGTSNMAISKNGEIVSTSCVNVGGRLLGIEEEIIWRIDNPAKIIMKELDLNYDIGDKILIKDLKMIVEKFEEVLREVVNGPASSNLAKELMMTEDLDFSYQIDEIAFSGGVGELIYGVSSEYRDMGHLLAMKIKENRNKYNASIVEPDNKIRATVIGAGAYSLTISGSTSFSDENIKFPIKNIPVLKVNVDREFLSIEHVIKEIKVAYSKFDLEEGQEIVALYFIDPVRAAYKKLKLFAQAIELSLPETIRNNLPIILIFERDIGNSIGNVIRRETSIKENLMAIDELSLNDGDWIDLGAPLVSGQVFPVTIKSLVFNSD